jgi:hypothetical protein
MGVIIFIHIFFYLSLGIGERNIAATNEGAKGRKQSERARKGKQGTTRHLQRPHGKHRAQIEEREKKRREE